MRLTYGAELYSDLSNSAAACAVSSAASTVGVLHGMISTPPYQSGSNSLPDQPKYLDQRIH